ncbi:hypothetical protein CK203_026906 [Vitis vinifera]|uniref:Uncharacterized protein n=1 Tax=Vitis vinifera TaxID=29760 RepID=A0A438IPA8_VITVI|nr:hypothetical protein CK203_026906 [Vitis vinifera]
MSTKKDVLIWIIVKLTSRKKHSELQVQSSSPAAGASHPGSAAANIPYATPPQLGAGHAMVLSSKGPAF